MAVSYVPGQQGQVAIVDPNPQLLFLLGRAVAILESLAASQDMMPGIKEQIDRLSIEVKHAQEKIFAQG